MGRPRKTAHTIRVDIVLTLTAGVDDDLLERFARLAKRQRSQWVKAALRGQAQIETPEPSTDDSEFLADLAF